MSTTHRFQRIALAPRLALPAAAAALVLLAAAQAEAREYFVSGTGTDANNNDGTLAKPFRTIQKAANLTLPGDIVTVQNGVYTNNNVSWKPVIDIIRSGSANAWIKYRAYPGHTPKLQFNGWQGVHVRPGAAYIEITGLDIEGNVKNTNLAYCLTKADVAEPLCNGNGIDIHSHHVRVAENEVHHCGAAGIGAGDSDYITIEDNLVHDNSWYTRYATSGISIGWPDAIDASTAYKMIVRRNRIWNNKTLIKWEAIDKLSDGNGIIIDTTNASSAHGEYMGRTLIASNVTFNNGGSGIHAYKASHIDIVNNTAYNNGTVVGYAEIFSTAGNDINILNNIMYARTGGDATTNWGNKNTVYDYNIYFNGKAAVLGPNDLKVDPGFVKASTDPALADFQVKSSSPAVDSGKAQASVKDDIDGAPRPQGKAIDRGAHERTPPAQLIKNGGFETGNLTSWDVYKDVSVVSTAPIAGKFTARAGNATSSGGGEQRVSAKPGVAYTLKATGRIEGGPWGAVSYQFLDADEVEIGDASSLQFNATNAERSAKFTAPAGAAQIVVSFWTNQGFMYLDALSLVGE